MRVRAFAVLDLKAKAFLVPIFYPEVGQAVRMFTDAINEPKHLFSKHPEDYTLHEIGLYDDNTAKLEPFGPECVITGLQCIEASREPDMFADMPPRGQDSVKNLCEAFKAENGS